MDTRRRHPNVVFICADDLGWGDLGVYGHPEIETPNLDRLASEGTLFTQFYAGGPVCSPSRVAYLTGVSAAKTKVLRPLGSHAQSREMNIPDYLDPAFPTIMRQMKQAGYITGHFGKWHLSTYDAPGGPPLPPAYGVDEYKIDLPARVVGQDHYLFPPPLGIDGPGWEQFQYPNPLGNDRVIAGDRLIFAYGIEFVEKHRDRPFYLNLWSHTPHIPLYPTPELMVPYHYLRPEDPWPVPKQIYYAAVTALDYNIGRFLARLDELGLAGNTVVVFTSDHGPENAHLNENGTSGMGSTGPFRGHKVSLYEGGIRVPFLVRWPGKVHAGRVEDDSVLAGVDLLPTFCRLAGIEIPSNLQGELDGEDVSDVFLGASRARRTALYWENRFWYYGGTNDPLIHQSPILAIREGNWKLLMNPDGSRKELYNVPLDPSEVDNKMAARADIGERLARQLLRWYASMPGGVESVSRIGDHTQPGLHAPKPGDSMYPWPTSQSVGAISKRGGKV